VAADSAKTADELCELIVDGKLKSSTITAAFARQGKGKVTYSHRQHTKTEARAEIVRWVAESTRPFSIVSDHGFQSLMKTGRPGYNIPSPST
jgi:Hermes transposase DNA-binding domain